MVAIQALSVFLSQHSTFWHSHKLLRTTKSGFLFVFLAKLFCLGFWQLFLFSFVRDYAKVEVVTNEIQICNLVPFFTFDNNNSSPIRIHNRSNDIKLSVGQR